MTPSGRAAPGRPSPPSYFAWGCFRDFAQAASRRVGNHAVAAVVLGAIERLVGALEHVADRLALALESRKPNRDRDVDALGTLADRKFLARNGTAQSLRHHAGNVQ